ncbi:TlpA disulfide reductase family protein [Flavivirga sp. 57AJ16]|uniref:TlpA family protein disulfide reductase n=1 Tax=Flavivirga sp. 57AJ16 TaxID=3025307 RepID=UPI002366DDA2|nr:TlpA disulfide reductase family protein [Flavivirga sp. 57AJ16]MDD7886111.1 TlpA disulfide reductase family protein [Flavivirga sp. 57AJ16]
MKRFQITTIVLLLGLISCQKNQSEKEIIITGKITGKIPDIIEYTAPINGISFFGFKDTTNTDSLGNFQIKLMIDEPCFIELSNDYKAYGTVIAEPGMEYDVLINTEGKKNTFRVKSNNKDGQELYNQIENRSMIAGGHFELESKIYMKDSIESEIIQKIDERKEAEILKFKKLLEKKVISESFYKLVSTDREYFFSGIQGSVAFVNYLLSESGRNTLNKEEFSALWERIFKSQPISNTELLKSPWFYYYTENYLRYNELIKESIAIEKLSNIRQKDSVHTHNIEKAKQYLSDKQLEYYYAAYIYYEAINKNYEKELISLFQQFKNEYPTSQYSQFIEPEIIPIIAFHKKQSDSLNEKIKFIDDFSNINSLKEVVKGLNANRIYVDIWATWCGPCKKEFQYNAELYKFLKSKDVTVVYISIDKESREKKWREMINYYELEGYHIRANKLLNTDLHNLRGKDAFGIPWHILTDGNGNIIKKYISGPSQIETLEKQLNEK